MIISLNTIIQKITWKQTAFFTVLFAFLYILINYSGVGVAALLEITGGANILDFEFGYNKDEAYKILTALNEDGRRFYLTRILPIDFPFPFAYMLFYAGWIAFLLKYTTEKTWCKCLLFIPLLAMLSDWIENIGIITMLVNFPSLPTWAVFLASVAGIFKTVSTVISIVIIFSLLIAFLIKKLCK
jgi:hypothetical protein